MMEWIRLLSRQRLGRSQAYSDGNGRHRTDFQRDFDRIVFSSAFRRLQDKTQVFPLAQSDYVRTRLTHSLEASCVGRSLGTMVGTAVLQRHNILDIDPQDFGAIVATACLAHDIGNPPFGHSGEDAIRLWFQDADLGQSLLAPLTSAEQADFLRFEGNAQGFRILTRLQSPANDGGLQLTYATLGAYTKYPQAGDSAKTQKFGFTQADQTLFTAVASGLGLPEVAPNTWLRHPLAYLVEAADDICYRIVDVEDAFRQQQLSYQDAEELLCALLDAPEPRLSRIEDVNERIELLRAKTIGAMVQQTFACYMDIEAQLLAGHCQPELLNLIPKAKALAELRHRAQAQIYQAPAVAEIAIAGFQVLGGLLEIFLQAVNDVAVHEQKASTRSQMVLQMIPPQFYQPSAAPYQRMLSITDFVAGMTDSYAVNLYKKLTGISLP